MMSNGRNHHSQNEYTILNGHLHVVYASYILLALSLVLSLLCIPFFEGTFKLLPAFIIPLIHFTIFVGIKKRIIFILHAFTGLMGVVYLSGLLFALIMVIVEVVQPRRGSFKLYLLHASSISALLTNVIAGLLVMLFRVIAYIQNENTYQTIPEPI